MRITRGKSEAITILTFGGSARSNAERASKTERIDAMEKRIEWFLAHLLVGDETLLVHGDYRIFPLSEPGVLAVFDWEMSTFSHLLADFLCHCMTCRAFLEEFHGLKDHAL